MKRKGAKQLLEDEPVKSSKKLICGFCRARAGSKPWASYSSKGRSERVAEGEACGECWSLYQRCFRYLSWDMFVNLKEKEELQLRL